MIHGSKFSLIIAKMMFIKAIKETVRKTLLRRGNSLKSRR
ncbi:hypothetical protein HMPREF0208_02243 [Citrobacter koseri]|nr:hypothetical protein HMPREF0208_02243 [Citrobacter koseri]